MGPAEYLSLFLLIFTVSSVLIFYYRITKKYREEIKKTKTS